MDRAVLQPILAPVMKTDTRRFGTRTCELTWRCCVQVHGIVFVVDAANAAGMDEAATVFAEVFQHETATMKPVLVYVYVLVDKRVCVCVCVCVCAHYVFATGPCNMARTLSRCANKQDLPGALDEAEIAERLKLPQLRARHSVVKCVASVDKNGGEFDERIAGGLDWLLDTVSVKLDDLNERVKRDTASAQAARDERKRQIKLRAEKYRKEKKEAEAKAAAGQAPDAAKKATDA